MNHIMLRLICFVIFLSGGSSVFGPSSISAQGVLDVEPPKDTVTIGLIRLVNPDQFYHKRAWAADLHRYLIFNFQYLDKVNVVYNRGADQIVLDAVAEDNKRELAFDSDILKKANEILKADLLVAGHYIVDPKKMTVEATMKIITPVTMAMTQPIVIKGESEFPIAMFNTIFRQIAAQATGRYRAIDFAITEEHLEQLKFNESYPPELFHSFQVVLEDLKLGNYNEAINRLLILEDVGENLDRIYNLLAFGYEQLKNYDRMMEYFWKRFPLLVPETTERGYIDIHREMATNFKNSEQPHQALGEIDKAYKLAQKLKDEALILELEYERGKLLLEQGLSEEGLKLIQATRDTSKKNQATYLNALSTLDLAEDAFYMGGNAQAEKLAEEVLKTAQELDDSELLFRTQLILGEVGRSSGNLDSGTEYLKNAIAQAERSGDQKLAYAGKTALGNLLFDFMELELALSTFKEAFQIALTIRDPELASKASMNMALVAKEICECDYPTINEVVSQNLQVPQMFANLLNDRAVYRNAAVLKFNERNFNDAIRYLDAAKKISSRTKQVYQEISDNTAIAQAYIKAGDEDRAYLSNVNGLQLAEEIKDKKQIVLKFIDIGKVFALQEKFEQGALSIEKAIGLADQQGLRKVQMQGEYELARVYRLKNDLSSFNTHMEKAIELAKKLGASELGLYQLEMQAAV